MENIEVTKRQNELLLESDNLAKERNISQLLKLEIDYYKKIETLKLKNQDGPDEVLDSIIEEIEKEKLIVKKIVVNGKQVLAFTKKAYTKA